MIELAQGLSQPSIDWHALSPELVLTLAAATVLVVDLFTPEEGKWVAMPLSAAGIVGTLAAVVSLIGEERVTFNGTYVVDTFALVFKGLFCVIGLVIVAISYHYFRSGRYDQGEYYFLMLASLLGGIVMASARDLVTIFIAIELISIPAIVMTALRKADAKSNEAALKFFLFSVMSSAVMLFGMSLVYAATGATRLDQIRAVLGGRFLNGPVARDSVVFMVGDVQAPLFGADDPLIVLAVFFLIVGFGFKVSAVPFHFWAPDTYEGAPSPVAAFLSTASKIGGFVGLIVLMFQAFPDVAGNWGPVFGVIAALTMTVGNLVALRQQHIIRLLAYSGIAQSGYVLVTFALIEPGSTQLNSRAFQSAIIYLAIYALMDLGAFAVAVSFYDRGGTYFISDYAGLWQRNPSLALLMAAFLLSLAGVPPMAGAWAKLFVFLATIRAEVIWLAVVMGVNAVIAAWYYLFVVKKMFLEPSETDEAIEVPYLMRAAMGATAFALVAAFVYPPIITELAEQSASFFAAR